VYFRVATPSVVLKWTSACSSFFVLCLHEPRVRLESTADLSSTKFCCDPSSILYLDALERCGCVDDPDALVLPDRQKLPIAGDDEMGFGSEHCGDEVIVSGISSTATRR
jgi:hypothetical protein